MTGPLTPAETHDEIWLDPTGIFGKSDSLTAYQTIFTERRDSTKVHPIRVKIRTPDKRQGTRDGAPEGTVSEGIPWQVLRDQINLDEWRSNCWPQNSDSAVVIGRKGEIAKRISFIMVGSSGESVAAFTEEFQAQLLELFKNSSADEGDWPTTKANLLAILERDGSRAEELTGYPEVDVNAAQRYGLSLEPPRDLTKKP